MAIQYIEVEPQFPLVQDEHLIKFLTQIVKLNLFDVQLRDITKTDADLATTWIDDNLIRLFLDMSGLSKLEDVLVDEVFSLIFEVEESEMSEEMEERTIFHLYNELKKMLMLEDN